MSNLTQLLLSISYYRLTKKRRDIKQLHAGSHSLPVTLLRLKSSTGLIYC